MFNQMAADDMAKQTNFHDSFVAIAWRCFLSMV